MSPQSSDTNDEAAPRDKVITMRVTSAERDAIKNAAAEADRSVSDFARRAMLEANVSRRTRVPDVNRDAWRELAPALGNLNQLAWAANRFRNAISESGLELKSLRHITQLMRDVRSDVEHVRELVEKVRWMLAGAYPLEVAADALEDWARAARAGRLGQDSGALSELAERLRALSAELEREGGR
jgi:uncharacterized protein (DUF1778 family)